RARSAPGSSASASISGSRRSGRPGGRAPSPTRIRASERSAAPCRASRLPSASPLRLRFRAVRPVGVIGHLSRDVVAGAAPQIGGGPWHAARALRALRHDALVFAKCGGDERRDFGTQLAALGLPVSLTTAGETTSFSFSYDGNGARTMAVEAIGDPWHVDELPQALLRRVAWLQVAPLLHGDLDPAALEWLARDRRILLDGQGLVRQRQLGPLVLDGSLDRDL